MLRDARTRHVPKAGHTAEEYEDAAAGPAAVADGTVRAAVADGATESAFAGLWARTLVEGFVEADATLAETFGEFVHRTRRTFGDRVAEREAGLAWYASAKAEEGAHAAFLGFVIYPSGAWRAVAVGDCCLFHLREGELLEAWPLDDPGAFDNRPALVGSRFDGAEPDVQTTSGAWADGDRIVLATDALAAYLLGNEALPEVFEDVEAFVAEARADGMRNDDVTLVELVLGA